ncbi:MAG: hypothetical protein GX800_01840 [Clostridiaceae bacterium]|jgi:hypothetical protein|nr:hypothetical protein [Clostridiaceae bacterium]
MKNSLNMFLLFVLVIFITGCSAKKINYLYIGENDRWKAEYKVNATETFSKRDSTLHYENNVNNVLTVTLKKELSEMPKVKHMEISYETSVSSGKMSEDYDDISQLEKRYVLRSGNSNGAIVRNDEAIKVTINLDGNIEVIELSNNKK